jgi:hypothetical protein
MAKGGGMVREFLGLIVMIPLSPFSLVRFLFELLFNLNWFQP